MARGIVCEEKCKQLNWATYVEWTNVEQLWHAKAKGGVGVDDWLQDMYNEKEQLEEEEIDMQEVSE